MAALIVKPCLALGIPLCFLISAIVIIFYFEIEDYKKIKTVEKKLESLESQFVSLRSSMNLKNL